VRFGIWNIFNAARTRSERGTYFEFHFRHSMSRLLHALDRFQIAFQTVGKKIAAGLDDPRFLRWQSAEPDAGIAADAILMYLNMVIDDLGRVIPVIFEQQPLPSFSRLKKRIEKDDRLVPGLAPLFADLDAPRSWWSIAFEFGTGMRQQIVHYPSSIQFAGQGDGQGRIRPVAYLWGPDVRTDLQDFETELRALLHDWCEWLDRLDALLRPHIGDPPAPWPDCPQIPVPVALSDKWRRIPSRDFLYLPVCDGSGAIGGRVKLSVAPRRVEP